MSKEELAKRIKDRIVKIGTVLKHMESVVKYSQDNKGFEDAFVDVVKEKQILLAAIIGSTPMNKNII